MFYCVRTGHNAYTSGDSLTLSWIEDNLEKTIVCAQPRHVTDLSIAFNWPKKKRKFQKERK